MFYFVILFLWFSGSTTGQAGRENYNLVNNGTHYLLQGVSETESHSGSKAVRNQGFSVPLVKLGSRYYLFSNHYKLNFFEAFRFCEDFGLSLISVENDEDGRNIWEFMKKQLKIVPSLWTSGQDLGTKREFVWLSSGRRMGTVEWEKGHPFIDERNHCVQVKKTDTGVKFLNTYCWDTADFLCEMKSCPTACI